MELVHLLAGLSLAAPAGLNAYLPLLIVALAGKFGALHLTGNYSLLTEWWAIGLLLLLLTIELGVDKVPGLDHANDLLGTVVRPAAGAVLFLAHNNAFNDYINPAFALVLGLLAAGSVHAVKATSRPVVTVTTAGLGNPLVSIGEDLVAAITAVLALTAPILAFIFLVLMLGLALWLANKFRRRALALGKVISGKFNSSQPRQP